MPVACIGQTGVQDAPVATPVATSARPCACSRISDANNQALIAYATAGERLEVSPQSSFVHIEFKRSSIAELTHILKLGCQLQLNMEYQTRALTAVTGKDVIREYSDLFWDTILRAAGHSAARARSALLGARMAEERVKFAAIADPDMSAAKR